MTRTLPLLLALLLSFLPGCIRPPAPPSDRPSVTELATGTGASSPSSPLGREAARNALASNAAWMKWVGLLFVVLGVLTLIASFLPWTWFIPRNAAIGGFAGGLACWAIQYILLVYGVLIIEVAFWVCLALTIAAGIFVGYPLVVAWRNRQLQNTGKSLIAQGDTRAGVALISAAQELSPAERKSLLTSLTPGAGGGS